MKTLQEIMNALEAVGTQRTKKIYMSRGVVEPVFGVTIKDLKPIVKTIGIDQDLAEQLYNTGNYDAMYLAGMIADIDKMQEADFERWMDLAYTYMISDYTIAIVLTESTFAVPLALKWIDSGEELRASAGWSTFTWLLGVKPDAYFDKDMLLSLLKKVEKGIHTAKNRETYAMNSFLMAVAISYLPLHEEAKKTAERIGPVTVDVGNTNCKVALATEYIEKNIAQGRIGFKRKHARC